ncbi:hypothetical protein [Pseudoruminococcus massiliensis]|jgi:hypothetical protein|uniref:hypothetical protein n=1 Tax=Pseudoruminococcus massiliensis TaxID=2086583 RepID=UPI00307C759E
MISFKQNEYNKIFNEINKKLSTCGYTIDDLFFHHLHFDKKFTDPFGVYIAIEKQSYIVYYLNIHGVENKETFSTREELIFQIIWDGVVNYTLQTYKNNYRKAALDLLRKIDINYYNRIVSRKSLSL